MDHDPVDNAIRDALKRELNAQAPQDWGDATVGARLIHTVVSEPPPFRPRRAQTRLHDTPQRPSRARTPRQAWWWVAVSTGFAAVLAVGLSHWVTGSGNRSLAGGSPPIVAPSGSRNVSGTPGPSRSASPSTASTGPSTYIGDTGIIAMNAPAPHQGVTPGSTMIVSGTIISNMRRHTVQIQLFAHDHHNSAMLVSQTFHVDSAGKFSGTLTVPVHIPPRGTTMQLWVELLQKGGPSVSTTLTAQ